MNALDPDNLARAKAIRREADGAARILREVGLAEHLETHVVQRHARLLDIVDVHGHGRRDSEGAQAADRHSEC